MTAIPGIRPCHRSSLSSLLLCPIPRALHSQEPSSSSPQAFLLLSLRLVRPPPTLRSWRTRLTLRDWATLHPSLSDHPQT